MTCMPRKMSPKLKSQGILGFGMLPGFRFYEEDKMLRFRVAQAGSPQSPHSHLLPPSLPPSLSLPLPRLHSFRYHGLVQSVDHTWLWATSHPWSSHPFLEANPNLNVNLTWGRVLGTPPATEQGPNQVYPSTLHPSTSPPLPFLH